jgi:hypothetical protein
MITSFSSYAKLIFACLGLPLCVAALAAPPLAPAQEPSTPKGNAFPPLNCDTLPSGPITQNVDFETQVYPLLVGNCVGGCGFSACINCHAGPATPQNRLELDGASAELTALALLDVNRDWIIPTQPRTSRLYAHINCSAVSGAVWRMPLVGNAMTATQQAIYFDWITQGARANFEDVPLSDVIFRNNLESVRR